MKRSLVLLSALLGAAVALPAQTPDPRVGLAGGVHDARSAILNMRLVAHAPKPEGWFLASDPGSFFFANSDLAFKGNLVFQGSFNGIQVWDLSDPAAPKLRKAIPCPGGQGDVSVHGNLLFMSVEMPNGRVDCGAEGITDTVSTERFQGVRVFDITDVDNPKAVAQVQTCRGSHTHTLLVDPKDTANAYVYVSGTGAARSPNELKGCSGLPPDRDPNSAYFRIEVIKVPLAAPATASIVNAPRIFADARGNAAGLWMGGSHGAGTQETSATDQCHDITVYAEIGLAGGACSGNGLLLDIKDPANPKRVAEVTDPNFAYWHSATFSNDGKTVLFTDEWGGGTQARCQASDKPTWGANAIFRLDGNKLTPAGYYKLPAAQTAAENCVAHNGNMIPVPGRNIMVQAWYQGGISVFDFTDPARPFEIAYFDRGPLSAELTLGGHWSAYWYNGRIIASEIARGLDVFELTPSAHLSQAEIDAAKSIVMTEYNAQAQRRFTWPPSISVATSYLDQLERGNGLAAARVGAIRTELTAAAGAGAARASRLHALAAAVEKDVAGASDGSRVRALAAALHELASAR